MNCSLPGSSVHGFLYRSRILGWIAISSSRGSSWLRNQTRVSCVSCIAGGFFIAKPVGNQNNDLSGLDQDDILWKRKNINIYVNEIMTQELIYTSVKGQWGCIADLVSIKKIASDGPYWQGWRKKHLPELNRKKKESSFFLARAQPVNLGLLVCYGRPNFSPL